MSSYSGKKIYDLLPAIYRQRDIENGSPLKALIDIIADQMSIVEQDIDRTYKNWFIETCEEWVIPYIADLVKTNILFIVNNATYSQRAWVANTIDFRKRKGTLSLLESLAKVVTGGWDCKAVEFFERLITTQNVNHIRPLALATVDVHQTEALDRISSPFDTLCYTPDVRSIENLRGMYNIQNIGLFLWTLLSLPVIRAPAFDHGQGRYSFSQLGYDQPVFNRSIHSTSISTDRSNKLDNIPCLSSETNIAAPIRRMAMLCSPTSYYDDNADGIDGADKKGKSMQISVDGIVKRSDDIVVCDLVNWNHRPDVGKIAVDPTLGRILFPADEVPESVHVTYFYGFSSMIGGGFYARSSYNRVNPQYRISKNIKDIGPAGDNHSSEIHSTIFDAIKKWVEDGRPSAIFEILDTEFYEEQANLGINIPEKTKLILRTTQQNRCTVRLGGPINIKGEKDSSIILDGIIFDTLHDDVSGVQGSSRSNNILIKILPGNLGSIFLKHCTLVPGRGYQTEDSRDLKLLFRQSDLLTDAISLKGLQGFIHENFSIGWIKDPNVKFEFVSQTVLKISHSSDKSEPFLTIILGKEGNNTDTFSKGEFRINYPDDAKLDKSSYKSRILYDFLVENKNGDRYVYLPKISLFIAPNSEGILHDYPAIKQGGIGDVNIDKITNNNLTISLDSSICGRILVVASLSSNASVYLNNSIVDGKNSNNSAIQCLKLRSENSTIFGLIDITAIELASNTIFSDTVKVTRCQVGCLRYCYLPTESHTPMRYHCQPEFSSITDTGHKNGLGAIPVKVPIFTSVRYGDPGYAQLSQKTPRAISEGADNGSEIGVFNNLYKAQRIKNLERSLEEYLRFGRQVGIFLVS